MLTIPYKDDYIQLLMSTPQTFGYLRQAQSYDVLGLLCELHHQITKTPWLQQYQDNTLRYSYLGCQKVLPDEVRKFFNLTSHDPLIKFNAEFIPLSVLNDRQIPLSTIAKLIS